MISAKRGQMILEATHRIIEKKYYLNDEVSKFYVFHVPTNRILRRGIIGYENAKLVSSKIRKQYGYRFNDIKFKIDRGQDKTKSSPSSIDNRFNDNDSNKRRIYRYQTAKGHWKDWDE